MSTAGYTRRPYKIFIVEYSYGGKRFKRPSCEATEELALKDTKESILMSWRNDFEMKVIEIIEY